MATESLGSRLRVGGLRVAADAAMLAAGHGPAATFRIATGTARRCRDAVARLDPSSAEAEHLAGETALSAGDHLLALRLLDSASRTMRSPPASLFHSLGQAAIATGRLEVAEAAFRHSLAIQPTAFWSEAELAEVLVRDNRLDEAETALRHAIELDDGDGWFWYRLGHDILRPLGRLREAGDCLIRAAAAGFPDPADDVSLRLGTGLDYTDLRASPAFREQLEATASDANSPPSLRIASGSVLLDCGHSSAGAAAVRSGFHDLLSARPDFDDSMYDPSGTLPPSFLVLGPPKSGTTSLFRAICRHPGVIAPARKELSYWDRDGERNLADYLGYFAPVRKTAGFVTGEATTTQLYQPEIADELSGSSESLRAIVLRRDPVARAYSHFEMHRRQGHHDTTFERAMAEEIQVVGPQAPIALADARAHWRDGTNYLVGSCLLPFIEAWTEALGAAQVLVVDLDLLDRDASPTLDEIYDFLNLPPMPLPPPDRLNTAHYPPLAKEIDDRLRSWFDPHERALDSYLENGSRVLESRGPRRTRDGGGGRPAVRRRLTKHRRRDKPVLAEFHHRLDALLQPALAFWKTAVDWERGGFFGKVDYRGRPRPEADKDLIQQARHLWTFAEVHRLEEPSEEIAAICNHQFEFVKDKLFDPTRSEFHTSISASGQPTTEGLHHYALAFAIFGLANHATTFADTSDGREALQIAGDVFATMARKSWDEENGFDETKYPDRWCTSPKEINTQMHLMEALVALLEAARVHHSPITDTVEEVLERQVELVHSRAIVTRAGRTFCSRGYDHDWTLIDQTEIDYGHDIEMVYLVMQAARAVGRDTAPEIIDRAVRLGRSVTDAAYDPKRGRWFYSGNPITGAVRHDIANIWTSFEALNGLSVMYRLTGEAEFVEKYNRVLRWLENKQINRSVGEWYYNVDKRGRPVDHDVFGADCAWMSFAWKSSYHSIRALLHGKRWLRTDFPIGEFDSST